MCDGLDPAEPLGQLSLLPLEFFLLGPLGRPLLPVLGIERGEQGPPTRRAEILGHDPPALPAGAVVIPASVDGFPAHDPTPA